MVESARELTRRRRRRLSLSLATADGWWGARARARLGWVCACAAGGKVGEWKGRISRGGRGDGALLAAAVE